VPPLVLTRLVRTLDRTFALKLVEQRLGVFQIRVVESFSESAVYFNKHRARFVGTDEAARHSVSDSLLQARLAQVVLQPLVPSCLPGAWYRRQGELRAHSHDLRCLS
jgi:hypothetical protein